MQKIPAFCVYISEMTHKDIDRLLRDYCQVWERMVNVNPVIDYYILAKFLEGKTTSKENLLVAGMMARDETIYELIRDSRMDMDCMN